MIVKYLTVKKICIWVGLRNPVCVAMNPPQQWCYSVTRLFLFLKTPFCSLVTSLVAIFISQTDADGAAGVTDVCSGTNRLHARRGHKSASFPNTKAHISSKHVRFPPLCVHTSSDCPLSSVRSKTLPKAATFRDYFSVLSLERLDMLYKVHSKLAIMFLSSRSCTPHSYTRKNLSSENKPNPSIALSSHTFTPKLWHQPPITNKDRGRATNSKHPRSLRRRLSHNSQDHRAYQQILNVTMSNSTPR